MKRTKGSCKVEAQAKGAPARVSIRAIYSEAMRDVLADPRKAIAEYDPWLSALLAAKSAPAPKG